MTNNIKLCTQGKINVARKRKSKIRCWPPREKEEQGRKHREREREKGKKYYHPRIQRSSVGPVDCWCPGILSWVVVGSPCVSTWWWKSPRVLDMGDVPTSVPNGALLCSPSPQNLCPVITWLVKVTETHAKIVWCLQSNTHVSATTHRTFVAPALSRLWQIAPGCGYHCWGTGRLLCPYGFLHTKKRLYSLVVSSVPRRQMSDTCPLQSSNKKSRTKISLR